MADTAIGILRRSKGGAGTLYDSAKPSERLHVPPQLIRKYGLVEGATVRGPARGGKKGPELTGVDAVCGLSPERFRQRTPFRDLIAIDACERFRLEATGDLSMRIVELIAPVGRGTRGLIVSPPKAGKTLLLEQFALAIRADSADTRIIVLLVDERPEEVTYFRRSVDAEVFASSSDRPLREHVALSELMMAHIRAELECGHDIVVLVDSLTRMSRTFNLRGSSHGRTLSGGLDAGAMEIPRRFFGLARNIENGGSVTILATVLVDTGSRMDQLIFEEFKGTGNCEIILDRSLADARIFPAINVQASGTRKEELLYAPEDAPRLASLHRLLAGRKPQDALELMFRLLEKHPTNEDLLRSMRS